MQSEHNALNPTLTRYTHYLIAGMIVVLVVTAPLFLLIGLFNPTAFFFGLVSVPSLLIALPLLFLSAATPPVTVSEQGLTLRPILWKPHFIAWDDIQAVKPYPILPSPDAEVFRRALVGRKKYRPAEGIMLIVPKLPFPYRAVGFFAGEGGQPVVAFTNRTHTHYDALARHITRRHPLDTAQRQTPRGL